MARASDPSREGAEAGVILTWVGSSPSATMLDSSIRPEVVRWNVQLPGFSTTRLLVSFALSHLLFAQLLVFARSGGVLVRQSVLGGTPVLASGSVPRRPASGLALASRPPRRSVSGSALTIVSTAWATLVFFLELYWTRQLGTPLPSAPRFAVLTVASNALHFTERLHCWMPFFSIMEYL